MASSLYLEPQLFTITTTTTTITALPKMQTSSSSPPIPPSPILSISPPPPISFRRPPSQQFRTLSRRQSSTLSSRSPCLTIKLLRFTQQFLKRLETLLASLTPLQQLGLCVVALGLAVAGTFFLVYHQQIFHFLAFYAQKWRDIPAGWLILWAITFCISFPPLIGYSTCVGLAGFVFGMRGWSIVASASTLGALAAFTLTAFLTSRPEFSNRVWAREPRFAALAQVLKHDGPIRLLIMIRLCPLPFALTNGMLATVPTVTPSAFFAATALATPKLLLHVWIGKQMALLGEDNNHMTWQMKLVTYLGIAFGLVAGLATGYIIWYATQKKIDDLTLLEATAGNGIIRDEENFDDEEGGRGGGEEGDIMLGLEEIEYTDELDSDAVELEPNLSLIDHEVYEPGMESDDK